jgi:hypothetical protein
MDREASHSSEAAMRVIIFGTRGMAGHGALHECLRNPEVERVVSAVCAKRQAA